MNKLLSDFEREIRQRNMNVYAVSVVENGSPETVRFKDDSNCRDVYSVSKAFAMAAIGFLFDEGKIRPTDTVADIFGTELPDGADRRWLEVTVHDALRHRTGLTHGNVDIDSEDIIGVTGDWLDYLFTMPLEGVRGETYYYTDAAYYLLSRMVSKIAGVSLYDYLRVKLFRPLGFKEAAWSTCPEGHSAGGSGLFVSCEDMVKLGVLWLNGGKYDGEQLISSEWCDMALQNDYAFSLRSKEKQSYYKTGMKGQLIYFEKSTNTVVGIQSYVESKQMSELVNLLLKV